MSVFIQITFYPSEEHNIKYLKWDMNRHLTEPGWPSAPTKKQREVRIRYTENLYRLVDELKKNFPMSYLKRVQVGEELI